MTICRHVAAFAMLGLSLAAVALWWRSYQVGDLIETGSQKKRINVSSAGGRLEAFEWYAPIPPEYPPFRLTSEPHTFSVFNWKKGIIPLPYYRFTWKFTPLGGIVQAPHWSLALLTLAAAFAVRPSPCFRFSMRQVLIAVTLAAVAFGLILGTMPPSRRDAGLTPPRRRVRATRRTLHSRRTHANYRPFRLPRMAVAAVDWRSRTEAAILRIAFRSCSGDMLVNRMGWAMPGNWLITRRVARRFVTVSCVVLYLVIMVFWARSYYRPEHFRYMRTGCGLRILSYKGVVEMGYDPQWGLLSASAKSSATTFRNVVHSFEFRVGTSDYLVRLPHWLIGFTILAVGIVPSIPLKRFSMRAMLIGVALLALLMGTIIVWSNL